MEKQAVIKTLPEALKMIKEMNLTSRDEWTGEYQEAARKTVAKVLREQMEERIAGHLSWAYQKGIPDRRNGVYLRHLLTELGDVEISMPRTRSFSPKGVIAAYARRIKEIDHLILACFLLGLSTRKVGIALSALLGERISPQTVSRVARTLDGAVKAFHGRRLGSFRALILDGIVITRKTGAGTVKRPVLVALGIRHDGKKEVIDFRLAQSESGAEWRVFLTNLASRGLAGFEVICADGGEGLISILPEVYPSIPLQRCWAHKMRNILDKVPGRNRTRSREVSPRSMPQRTSPRRRRLRTGGRHRGRRRTPKRSSASGTISMISSPASSSPIPSTVRPSGRPMRSSEGSARYEGGRDPWECSATGRVSREYSMRSSCTRTSTWECTRSLC